MSEFTSGVPEIESVPAAPQIQTSEQTGNDRDQLFGPDGKPQWENVLKWMTSPSTFRQMAEEIRGAIEDPVKRKEMTESLAHFGADLFALLGEIANEFPLSSKKEDKEIPNQQQ
ncbi:hypothetical protein GYA49_02020 [Candidatus Beckwithbacteria bacterium]|nr:hypothetical protein [Candidatus Beckwithbacteria bacterium]